MARKSTKNKETTNDVDVTNDVVDIINPTDIVEAEGLVVPEVIPEIQNQEILRDAWDREIPTVKIRLQDTNYNSLIKSVIRAGRYGAVLNPTQYGNVHYVPFSIHLLMPEENHLEYAAGTEELVFNPDMQYNKVSVQATDRITFFKTLLQVSQQGGFMAPNTAAMKTPKFSATLLTRHPIANTYHTAVSPQKVKYEEAELQKFSIAELTIVGSWYNLSYKSKDKYVKGILEAQTQE